MSFHAFLVPNSSISVLMRNGNGSYETATVQVDNIASPPITKCLNAPAIVVLIPPALDWLKATNNLSGRSRENEEMYDVSPQPHIGSPSLNGGH